MKNSRKGFVALVVICILILVGAFVFFYTIKTEIPQSASTSCKDEPEGVPVITSLSSNQGPVGTTVEIKGCNFNGFEGDLNVWIQNSVGVKGILYSEPGSTAKSMKIVLKPQACTTDEPYRGLPCASYLSLVPGAYKIYTMPWGKKSNEVTFTIKPGSISPVVKSVITKPSSELVWVNSEDKIAYEKVTWNFITSTKLGGLSKGVTEISCSFSKCDTAENNNHLRREGGLGATYYDLELKTAGSVVKINSIEKLKTYFAPVQSEAEAASFVGVKVGDLQFVYDADILSGQTATISGGYLVKVTARNTFGCSAHTPSQEVFKVTTVGDMSLIASEPVKPGNLCVD